MKRFLSIILAVLWAPVANAQIIDTIIFSIYNKNKKI